MASGTNTETSTARSASSCSTGEPSFRSGGNGGGVAFVFDGLVDDDVHELKPEVQGAGSGAVASEGKATTGRGSGGSRWSHVSTRAVLAASRDREKKAPRAPTGRAAVYGEEGRQGDRRISRAHGGEPGGQEDALAAVRAQGRMLLDQGKSIEEMEAFYLEKLSELKEAELKEAALKEAELTEAELTEVPGEAEAAEKLEEQQKDSRWKVLQLHALRQAEARRRSSTKKQQNARSGSLQKAPAPRAGGDSPSSLRGPRGAESTGTDLRSSKSGLRSSKQGQGLRASALGLHRSSKLGASQSSDMRRSSLSDLRRSSLLARRTSANNDGEGEELLRAFLGSVLGKRPSWRIIVDPDARWLPVWGLIQVLCAMYSFSVVLWRIAFRSGTQFMPDHPMTWSAACAIDWCCDLLLLSHMLLQLVLGFVDSSNNKVMDHRRISRAYVRSRSFMIHVIVLCPLDLFQLVQGQWVPACRLNKLVRVLELRSLLKHLLDAFRVRVHFQRLLWHILLMMLLSHTSACVYFMFGSLIDGFSRTSWSPPLEMLNETAAMQYFDSVYWSLGLMTGLADGCETHTRPRSRCYLLSARELTFMSPSGSDIPETGLESLFTLSVMMAGVFLFATIIGNVSTMVDELNENEGDFQTKLLLMSRMTKQHQLPRELEDRVMNYYTYQYKNHQGFDHFQMLQTLPAGLRTDILLKLTRTMIEQVPFFKGEAEGFFRSLVDRLKPQIASAGEALVRAGQITNEMYFVHRGEFDVLVGSPPVIVARLRQGNYFGEALTEAKPRAATIQARTFCDLFVLTQRALTEVLPYYPETEAKMHELVAKKLEEDRLKERQAKLTNTYGQRFIQLLRRRQQREATSRPKPRPNALTRAHTCNLAAIGRAAKSPQKLALPPPKPAVDLGQLAADRTKKGKTVTLAAPARPQTPPRLLMRQDTKKGAATFKLRALTSEIGGDMQHAEAFQKSIQSQNKVRSRTPWLARAIGVTRARSEDDYFFVVLPYGCMRQLWLLLMFLATTWNVCVVPYSIAFIWGFYKLTHGVGSRMPLSVYGPVLFVDLFADLTFVVDVFLSQRLAFVDDQGILVKDARVIRQQFFKTRLRRAICAAVTLDVVMLAAYDWCPLLRLNRLINFDKVFSLPLDLLQSFESSSNTSPKHTTMRISRLLFVFFAISHYIACLSMLVSAFGTPLASISYALQGSSQYPDGVVIHSAFPLYLRAIYFAVSNLTGLGRDVKPVTVPEHLLTLIVWCLGIFVFAYTIGTVRAADPAE